MTVSNSKTPTSLDEAVRMFKGYVRGENGFDELDFKEWLIEWREQEIVKARIDELEQMPSGAWRMGQSFLFERLNELKAER